MNTRPKKKATAAASTARSANDGRKSAPRKRTSDPKRLDLKRAPHYTQAEQALIQTFLGVAKEAAVNSRNGVLAMVNGTARPSAGWDTFDYWNNVVSGIDWLLWRSTNRQKHLLIAKHLAENPTEPT